MRASSTKSFNELVSQLCLAAESPIPHIDGQSYLPESVIFVTPYAIDYRVLKTRFEAYSVLSGRGLRLIDGPKLINLIQDHLPQLALRLSGVQSARTYDVSDPDALVADNHDRENAAFDYITSLHYELGQLLAPKDSIDSKLCFVIMSFSGNPRLADFYEKAIKPTVEELGYRCERVDEQHFNGSIRQQILQNIRQAKFVIADMTEARPNCYYELGVAHATRKHVIHLAFSIDDVHFDVKDFNFIFYSRIDELATLLKERIIGTVGSANSNDGR